MPQIDVYKRQPYISEVDLADIVFGVEHGFDFIAASFVRTKEDIQEVRKDVYKRQALLAQRSCTDKEQWSAKKRECRNE